MDSYTLGKYKVIGSGPIGHGTSALVYLAVDPDTNRRVVIKLITGELDNPQKFRREARIVGNLEHPNIVRLYNVERIENKDALVMEYMEGGSLRAKLDAAPNKRLSIEESLKVVAQILMALEYARAEGRNIVHGDIKPANVFLTNDGTVKLGDFGSAEVLATQESAQLLGTRAYMAPECFADQPASDHRSDLWSVGVMLYEMLAGQRPFRVEPAQAHSSHVWQRVTQQPPRPLAEFISNIPAALQAIIRPALQPDKAERFQSATEFLNSFKRHGLYPLPISPDHMEYNKGATKVNSIDGTAMVWISAGTFQMGSNGDENYRDEDYDNEDEEPVHAVTLSGFWMYRRLVTVAQFRHYDAANGSRYNWNGQEPDWGWQDDHPMVRVSWTEAAAYAKWAGVALPTEAQWEYAARGGLEGKEYPWGNGFDPSKLRCWNKKWADARGPSAVGSYPANGYGLYDMAGNVWEWCADWYDENYYKTAEAGGLNPTGPTSGDSRVLRGSSWDCGVAWVFRCAVRFDLPPDIEMNYIGFRCCALG